MQFSSDLHNSLETSSLSNCFTLKKKKKKSFKFQTLHQYCWIIKVHTYYHYQRDITLKKQIFNVYKSVNFFFLFFPPPPRNEPRITPIAQWTVKNKFQIDHNDTIPLTKLSWPSNQQNSKHWRKLNTPSWLYESEKKKKKKCWSNHRYHTFTKTLRKMDIS